jgi:hypothetical protein
MFVFIGKTKQIYPEIGAEVAWDVEPSWKADDSAKTIKVGIELSRAIYDAILHDDHQALLRSIRDLPYPNIYLSFAGVPSDLMHITAFGIAAFLGKEQYFNELIDLSIDMMIGEDMPSYLAGLSAQIFPLGHLCLIAHVRAAF